MQAAAAAARRRKCVQGAAASIATAAAVWLCLPSSTKPIAQSVVVKDAASSSSGKVLDRPSVATTAMSESELLDSFDEQPVALVKWPDGRQALIAIVPAASVQ